MESACQDKAKTIHRLLEYVYAEGRLEFQRGPDKPLKADSVIIDEMSMVDLPLFCHLLEAINPETTSLILVGDKDQLPSVAAGNVLGDLIASGKLPVTMLTQIYRQEEGSAIIEGAHAINNGKMPLFEEGDDSFRFREVSGPSNIADYLIGFIERNRDIAREMLFSDSLQVITPMKKGAAGVIALNNRLQGLLNPRREGSPALSLDGYTAWEGDRVMQTKNDYEAIWTDTATQKEGTGVFNGDIGIVASIDEVARKVVLVFDNERKAVYDFKQLANITLAYAITIHKSQGSEFDYVIMPVFPANPSFLTRNLLYTALTRAKSRAFIIGEKRILEQMVLNGHTLSRLSGLKDMLIAEMESEAGIYRGWES